MKRHIPFDGPEGLREIERIAVTFEENMYVGASSQVLQEPLEFKSFYVVITDIDVLFFKFICIVDAR